MSDIEMNFFELAEQSAAEVEAANVHGGANDYAEEASTADSKTSINEAMDEVTAAAAIDGAFETDAVDRLAVEHFPGKIVRKDLTALMKRGANVPPRAGVPVGHVLLHRRPRGRGGRPRAHPRHSSEQLRAPGRVRGHQIENPGVGLLHGHRQGVRAGLTSTATSTWPTSPT